MRYTEEDLLDRFEPDLRDLDRLSCHSWSDNDETF